MICLQSGSKVTVVLLVTVNQPPIEVVSSPWSIGQYRSSLILDAVPNLWSFRPIGMFPQFKLQAWWLVALGFFCHATRSLFPFERARARIHNSRTCKLQQRRAGDSPCLDRLRLPEQLGQLQAADSRGGIDGLEAACRPKNAQDAPIGHLEETHGGSQETYASEETAIQKHAAWLYHEGEEPTTPNHNGWNPTKCGCNRLEAQDASLTQAMLANDGRAIARGCNNIVRCP